jgi:hypothetical protein
MSMARVRTAADWTRIDSDGKVECSGHGVVRPTFVNGVHDDGVCVDRLLLDVSHEPAPALAS